MIWAATDHRRVSPRRVPDVVVVGSEVGDRTRLRAEQIQVAIEIATSGESAVRGKYRIAPRATGSVTLTDPFPLTIELDGLVGGRVV